MSREAWGDEGNLAENGRDTAIYQELCELRERVHKWRKSNANDFANDEQSAKADRIIGLMDELSDDLGNWKP